MSARPEVNSLPRFPAGIDPRLLAAAPHRLLFFMGAANVVLAMAWWTAWLIDARWHLFGLASPAVPAGWLHAITLQYQVLAPFIFGFLLTVLPRWMDLPALSKRYYVPVGIGLFGGQLLTLMGAVGVPGALRTGAVLTVVGWLAGFLIVLRLVWQGDGKSWHATSSATALALGFMGVSLYAAYLWIPDPRFVFFSIKLGAFGFLVPMYLTVAHRVFPFFATNVVSGYIAWRPLEILAVAWVLLLIHLGLELVHGYAWLWLADLPLLLLVSYWSWRTWPRGEAPILLRVLFLSFGWLVIALALYTVQSLWYATTGEFSLGRAPAHALFIGFFGSLLVAMVTRVTQGHSGRPLELGHAAGFALIVIQAVSVTRVVAEVAPDSLAWQAYAGVGWLIAFTPWVVSSVRIYLSPRVDGRPG